MTLRDLFLRLRALTAPHYVERELDEELAFHIERETRKHIAAGLSPADARRRALARFGPVPLAADECRDARGISFFDNLIRDVLYAFRTFRRAPLAALTIVATVALGLGLVAVVFTIYNSLFLRADAVRNPDELFAVELTRATTGGKDESLRIGLSDYEAMRRETSVFTDIVGRFERGDAAVYLDGRLTRGISVSGNFFEVLGVRAALGRPLLPSDDERFAGRAVIALSHAGWRKLFGGDVGVIGRRVTIAGVPHEVVGVMPAGVRGLALTPPDYWAPLAAARRIGGGGGGAAAARTGDAGAAELSTGDEGNALEAIGRLKPGVSREAAIAALSGWASGRAEFKTAAGRPIKVALTPRQGTIPRDGFDLVLFAPLFFAFGLILMIACANVANLLLARGVTRQREIGVRLSLGASRARIIRQLLTESLLLSLVAAAGGVVIARVFLDGVLYGVINTLPTEMAQFMSVFNLAAPTSDWRVLAFLAAGAVAATVFFGLAPALRTTRIDLVSTMRGEVTRGARPRRARHALIALQVGASALLLICAGIFLRGAVNVAAKDPGIRTIDTLRVSLDNRPRRAALVQAVISDPLVTKFAVASRTKHGTIRPIGAAPGGATPNVAPASLESVSSDYFDLFDIKMLHGRAFRSTERSADAGVMIVSEALARQFWPKGDGIGQLVRFEAPTPDSSNAPTTPSGTFTVIGIVRDAAPANANANTRKGIYLPNSIDTTEPNTSLLVRVRGNLEQTRVTLTERLTLIDPVPMVILSLQSLVAMQSYLLQMGSWVAMVLGGLALVLTVSGLFSMLSYVVEQQAREIGVRMALGAATNNVMRFILSQSMRPVAIGLATGGGLALAVAIVLMSTPLASEIGSDINVLDPVAYIASVLVIVASCIAAVSMPALRAARIDPIATLRND